MYKWVNEFKCARTSTRDELRSGSAVHPANPEIIEKVRDMILNYRRVKVRENIDIYLYIDITWHGNYNFA